MSYLGHSLVGVLPLSKGPVSVLYSPNQLGKDGKRESGNSVLSVQLDDEDDDIYLCKKQTF